MDSEDFAALLELARNPGEEGHPDDLFDRMSTSYDHATSTRDSAYQVQGESMAAQGEELAAAQTMITQLQAHNYTLMMQLEGTQVEEPDDSEHTDSDTDSGDPSDDSIWTVKE